MKILYVGADDILGRYFLERMGKEEYEVFFVAKNNFIKKERKGLNYKYYQLTHNFESIFQILKSISPEYIVYAGQEYVSENWEIRNNNYLDLFNYILENSRELNLNRIILLSSFEVYGKSKGTMNEKTPFCPISKRGMIEAEGEYLLNLYGTRDALPYSIIRCTSVYNEVCSGEGKDFLSSMYQNVIANQEIDMKENEFLFPLHIGDLVDAIKRVIENKDNGSFNLASSFGISQKKLYELIAECINKELKIHCLSEPEEVNYDISKATNELGWIDFKKLEDLLSNRQIKFVTDEIIESKKAQKESSTEIRKTMENIFVFSVFFVGYFFTKDHTLFSQINWMLLYVSSISLIMGIRQSALAVALACVASLFALDLNIFEMTNFYSYAEILLLVIQYVFFGISISYSSDMVKEKLRESERKRNMVEEELQELKEINIQNLTIKNEYEKRILDSKMSITQLYSIVSKIMVLNPERVFMEILEVISDLFKTQTVAIYMQNGENPHLRLLIAYNDDSTMGGKSWNISESEPIQDAIKKEIVFNGNVWENEPAIVVPISKQEKGMAVLVIKKLGFEQQSLYYMNLLRTLLILIKDAVDKALAYENLIKAEMYVGETGVLISKEFHNIIQIAREKYKKHNAEYSIIEIETNGNLKDAYFKADRFFRTTDYFGTNDEGRLFVLLGNTGTQEREFVLQRLEKADIVARSCSAFDEGA